MLSVGQTVADDAPQCLKSVLHANLLALVVSATVIADRHLKNSITTASDASCHLRLDPKAVLLQPRANFLDHLTHNVYRGNMDKWWDFYRDMFGFKQIHFFDIDGRITGLTSRAITSPCGKIRIPLNESKDDTSQIEEYLKKYKGEGIQHIAVGCDDIYGCTDQLAENELKFMPGPPQTYYDMSAERVNGHDEPLDRMAKHGILIDGEGVIDGGMTKILLQIFSKTVIGPIFFEFIQRKGDEGFGEGNFKALFESIERDQLNRGVLNVEEPA